MAHQFVDGPLAGQMVPHDKPPLVMRIGFNESSWGILEDRDERAGTCDRIDVYIGLGLDKHFRASRPEESGWTFKKGYRQLEWKPDQATLRDNHLWEIWCKTNGPQLMSAWASGGESPRIGVNDGRPSDDRKLLSRVLRRVCSLPIVAPIIRQLIKKDVHDG